MHNNYTHNPLRNDLVAIATDAIQAVDPELLLEHSCFVKRSEHTHALCMHMLPECAIGYDASSSTGMHSAAPQLQNRTIGYDVSAFSNVFLCAIGKAAEPMARYFLSQLGNRITDGVIITKERSASSMHGLPVYNGGHPLPNEDSIHNGNRVMALAERADANTLVINAISGGASALCLAPWQDPSISITLANYRTMMRLLLSNAVPIEKCNCIRSHISHIKGGKYLQHIFPALSVSFILSDVRYDNTRAIASGLTDPHRYSATNAIGILNEYHLWTRTPAPIRKLLQQTQHAEQQSDAKPAQPPHAQSAHTTPQSAHTQSAHTPHAHTAHTQSARHTASSSAHTQSAPHTTQSASTAHTQSAHTQPAPHTTPHTTPQSAHAVPHATPQSARTAHAQSVPNATPQPAHTQSAPMQSAPHTTPHTTPQSAHAVPHTTPHTTRAQSASSAPQSVHTAHTAPQTTHTVPQPAHTQSAHAQSAHAHTTHAQSARYTTPQPAHTQPAHAQPARNTASTAHARAMPHATQSARHTASSTPTQSARNTAHARTMPHAAQSARNTASSAHTQSARNTTPQSASTAHAQSAHTQSASTARAQPAHAHTMPHAAQSARTHATQSASTAHTQSARNTTPQSASSAHTQSARNTTPQSASSAPMQSAHTTHAQPPHAQSAHTTPQSARHTAQSASTVRTMPHATQSARHTAHTAHAHTMPHTTPQSAHTQSARHTASTAHTQPAHTQPAHAPHASNQNIIIGNTYCALQAAHKSATALGYTPIILTDCLVGEARHAAQFIASVCAFHLRHPVTQTPKVCLLFGGETTVTVTGAGKGGRNQELAVAFLKIALADEVLRKMQAHFAMISVATDGNDGPTDAAGGIIDADTIRIMHKKNISIQDALHNNDSYHFLKKRIVYTVVGTRVPMYVIYNVCSLPGHNARSNCRTGCSIIRMQ